MSNSEQNPSFDAGDLAEDFLLGCESALPYCAAPVTYTVVGRGALPESTSHEIYVRQKFDPTPKRFPA